MRVGLRMCFARQIFVVDHVPVRLVVDGGLASAETTSYVSNAVALIV